MIVCFQGRDTLPLLDFPFHEREHELLNQMASKQEKVAAEFQALWAFLVEQEERILSFLKKLSWEVKQKQNENLAHKI